MSADIDRLEAIARAAQEYGESIGEQSWYARGEVQAFANRGANGMCAIADPDDAHIATFSPSRVLALLAVVRAAKGVAYSNGFDAALPDKKESLLAALAALAQLEDRNG